MSRVLTIVRESFAGYPVPGPVGLTRAWDGRIEMDLQVVSDKLELYELLARYARGLDTKDWDLWKSVFTPDATLDYTSVGHPVGPPDEIASWLEEVLGPAPMTQHIITNVEIDLDGDNGRVRAIVCNPRILAGMTELSCGGGYYLHEVVRTPDGWKSAHLVEVNRWSTPNTPDVPPRAS